MVQRTAMFRADAGADIGGGHVMRCLALANALQERGWSCKFVAVAGSRDVVPELGKDAIELIEIDKDEWDSPVPIGTSGPADLLVIDHYGLDATFESGARSYADRIMAIEDLPGRMHDCDILFDQTFGREPNAYLDFMANPDATVLTGSQFALLRSSFAELRPAALGRRRTSVSRVLVSFGATDPLGMAVPAATAALESGIADVDIAVGSACPHLCELEDFADAQARIRLHIDTDIAMLMAASDVGIGAGGATAWERCCLALPSIIAVLAENQSDVAAALEAAGAVAVFECSDTGWSGLADELRKLILSPDRLQRMSKSASGVCDGQGAVRVCDMVEAQFA